MTTLIAHPHVDPSVSPMTERLTPADLQELMQSVTDVTQRLQTTHVALHEQVARLQRELAEANAALRRSKALAALGEMAAGIAHEVRNPLGSIQLYMRLLEDDLADRPDQAAICRKVGNAVVTIDAIVRDVLSFAREARVDLAPVTSSDIFQRSLQTCASLIQTGEIDVIVDDAPSCLLHADGGLLMQALSNVIRNAIEAMMERHAGTRRRLKLSAARRRMRCPDGGVAQRVALAVEDNGPGIPPEVRDRVFNPFFTTRKAGTGLGLAIVHRIVDAHGGHIVIENIRPSGTRVQLCLPARAEPNRSSPHAAGHP